MRAAVLEDFQLPFAVTELNLDDPGPSQLVVRMRAAPFCSTDWMGWRAMRGKQPPAILGHTAVGTVEAVGDQAEGFAVGDRVLVAGTPQCRECFYCQSGRPDQCSMLLDTPDPEVASAADGTRVRAAGNVGAYAEQLLVDYRQVHALPETLSDTDACLLGCGISTGLGAVFNIAQVQPGQSVAVLGVGHLGLWAVQAARLAGAGQIIAADLHPGRLAVAESLGATDIIEAGRHEVVEVVRGLTEGRGADVVIEAAGPETTSRQAVLMARRAGTVVLTGVAHARDAQVILPQLPITVHAKRIVGCQNGQIVPDVDFPRYISMLEHGQLRTDQIITGSYGIEELDTVARRSMALDDITGVILG